MKYRLQQIIFFNSFIIIQLCILSGLIIKQDNKCSNNFTQLCNKHNNNLKNSFSHNPENKEPIVLFFSLLAVVANLSFQQKYNSNQKNLPFFSLHKKNILVKLYIKQFYLLFIQQIKLINCCLKAYKNRLYCLFYRHITHNSIHVFN